MFTYTPFTRTDILICVVCLAAIITFGILYFTRFHKPDEHEGFGIWVLPAITFFFIFLITKVALHFMSIPVFLIIAGALCMIGLIAGIIYVNKSVKRKEKSL